MGRMVHTINTQLRLMQSSFSAAGKNPPAAVAVSEDAVRQLQGCVNALAMDFSTFAAELPKKLQRIKSSIGFADVDVAHTQEKGCDSSTAAKPTTGAEALPMTYVTWNPIARGQPIPAGAIISGCTKADGDVYVGKGLNNGPGKLITEKGRMLSILCHQGVLGRKEWQQGFVLTISPLAQEHRQRIQSGDLLPACAVHAGATDRDGEVFVGRETEAGACGKITQKNGVMHKLWVHGSRLLGRGHRHGEVLVVRAL